MFIFVQHRTRCSTPELRTSLSRTSDPSCASLRLRKRPNPHTDRERAVQKLVSPLLLSKAMATEDGAALQATVPTVERALGYRFRDQRLLLTALTHRSFCHENNTASGDFDELEWLGDSVLQLAISSWLFSSARGSRRSSGQLSRTRQRFVDAGACESFALQLNLVRAVKKGGCGVSALLLDPLWVVGGGIRGWHMWTSIVASLVVASVTQIMAGAAFV